MRQYEKSFDHFQRTLAARRSKKEKVGIISALVNMSVVLNNLNRYAESSEGLEEALELAREMNDPVQMRSCYGMLSETFEKAGNVERSIYYFNLYRSFHEMIQQEEVDILKYDLKEEQIVSEYERHKNKISLEELGEKQANLTLLKNEINAFDLLIDEYDSVNSVYVNSLNKKQLAYDLLQSENELKNVVIRESKAEHAAALEQARLTKIISGLIIVSVLIFCVFIILGYRQLKSYASHIKKKHEELERTQNQLIKSEKIASMGVLIAGIGHELNNPMNFVKNGALALSNLCDEHSGNNKSFENSKKEMKQFVTIINEGVSRSTKIINSLSHISKTGDEMNEECNFHEILDNCLIILKSTISDKTEILKHYNKIPVIITGNEGKLHQAVMNVLSNASLAMKDGGKLSLLTEISNGKALVSIADTGTGISPENLSRICDPFFTTRPPGEGTGLGLSITSSIIKEHKGEIEINSELGKGSKFIFSFPVKNFESTLGASLPTRSGRLTRYE